MLLRTKTSRKIQIPTSRQCRSSYQLILYYYQWMYNFKNSFGKTNRSEAWNEINSTATYVLLCCIDLSNLVRKKSVDTVPLFVLIRSKDRKWNWFQSFINKSQSLEENKEVTFKSILLHFELEYFTGVKRLTTPLKKYKVVLHTLT